MLSSKTKVLIVEDDIMVQKILAGFLNKIGDLMILDRVSTLECAKIALRKKNLDLVLLDVYLPDGTGTDLLKWMRQSEITTDVILLTADSRASTIATAKRYGATDYLVKPFKMERLKAAIERYKHQNEEFMKKGQVGQEVIDKVFNAPQERENQSYKNQTYELILHFLEENRNASYTSTEVAKNLGISRITARRYLENMENSGEVVLELAYGAVGRPKNKYKYGK